ncbi:U2 snRNP complex subunit msl1 [Castilleja foliolosa]|uniref:U2 snRNP complex subunit msl1 n=1 Tax=Castilleja foliolosa TaxID=1961234 RepID=A0ABD3BXX7_9LAMI
MAAMRIPRLNLFRSSLKSAYLFDVRPSAAYTTKCFLPREPNNVPRIEHNSFRMSGHLGSTFSSRLLGGSGFRGSLSFAGLTTSMSHRLFSSASEAKGSSIRRGTEVIADSASSGADNVAAGGPDDWAEKLKYVWQSTVEAVKYTGEKAKEASDEATPHVQQLLDTHPYLRDVIVPVGSTLAGTLLAWSLLPMLFRRFHKYSIQGPGALLAGSSIWGPVPYEKSFWGALEAPVRYFITFMAFLEIGQMVAPTVIASQYVTQAWGGAIVVSLVWFLHRWKTNVITRALSAQNIERAQRNNLLTLDKVSSVGLFVVGLMALAEACGVAVQSILTVGGIGGVATAFASKDILGNVLSGLTVQISQPFTIGDTIKAGSVEGQVVEMGLTTTSLLTAERFPVVVPNSLFASQVIVNKSRAKWRFMLRKIPLRTEDVDKIPQISEDIKTMLKSNANVFLDREPPYCFLSHIERSYAELTLGCNLKRMNKEAEQDILLEAVRIIKGHGAMLGSTFDDNTSSNTS